jgi:hypothetical protein
MELHYFLGLVLRGEKSIFLLFLAPLRNALVSVIFLSLTNFAAVLIWELLF